ncbi:MAG: signal peptide peptidase SppA [Candidatus Brocadiales bacterium]|nr:signal peptide peptidase SppA [Candidatus Brocadiales bacterium]
MDNPQAQREGRGVGFWAAASVAIFFFLCTFFLVAMMIGSLTAWKSLVAGAEAPEDKYIEEVVSGSGDNKIAILPIRGIIRTEPTALLPDDTATVESVQERLKHVKKDDKVKAVLLLIDSPGGGITASDVMYNDILKYRKDLGKKVVVLMGDVAASGGYYIAAAADKIIAHPTTVTGSIGVILPLINISDLIHRYGIKDDSITSGPLKDIGSPTRPMTPEEKEILEGIIHDMYERFVSVVAAGRNMPIEKVKTLADGRIYTAQQALEDGLVDKLGYLSDAIEQAKELAGLDEALVITYEKKWSLSDLFKIAQGITPPNVRRLFEWPEMDTPRLMYLWLPGFTQGIITR